MLLRWQMLVGKTCWFSREASRDVTDADEVSQACRIFSTGRGVDKSSGDERRENAEEYVYQLSVCGITFPPFVPRQPHTESNFRGCRLTPSSFIAVSYPHPPTTKFISFLQVADIDD